MSACMTLGVLTGPASDLNIIRFSRSGIKIGMVDWLKEWFPGRIVGCFELVSPCPKLTCSVILFDTADGITGFSPDISPSPRRFFQKMVHSSFSYDGSKAGRLFTKSP